MAQVARVTTISHVATLLVLIRWRCIEHQWAQGGFLTMRCLVCKIMCNICLLSTMAAPREQIQDHFHRFVSHKFLQIGCENV